MFSWFCTHQYKYIGRQGDIHMYRCTKCGKTTSNPIDG